MKGFGVTTSLPPFLDLPDAMTTSSNLVGCSIGRSLGFDFHDLPAQQIPKELGVARAVPDETVRSFGGRR